MDLGHRLPNLSEAEARSTAAAHELLTSREEFWRQRLEQFNIVQLPFSSLEGKAPATWQSSVWLVPSALAELSPSDRAEFLLAAWLVYLARITGESELQLGWTPVPSGSRAGVKALEALVASVVPMAITIDLDNDFAQARTAVAAEFAQLNEQDTFARDLIARCPTLRGVEALRLRRPWPVGVTLTRESCSAAEESASSSSYEIARSGELLTLEICALDGNFRWHFDASRLEPNQIERMTQHLQNLLFAVKADAQQPVSRVELLSSSERAYLLEELNRTAAAYPSDRCIHELFEAQVRQLPDAVAVVYRDQRVSYGELNARANRLAHHLIAIGVKPDQPVAICLQRSPMMVVGLLAILKAGGAYVPLDPAYPSARLHQVIEDAAPQLLLADAAGRAALGAKALADLTVVDLAAATPEWANLPASDPDPRALGLTSRHLAYVIYTSGSSGMPKGVEMPHRSLMNLLWSSPECDAPKRRTLQFTTLNFDVSFQELFSCWRDGGLLVLVQEEIRADFSELLDFVWREEIERLFLPFVALNHFAEVWCARGTLLPSLREVYTAGEQLRATPEIRSFFETHPRARLINQYGPTETHVVTEHHLAADPSCWPQLPPIGRPIANTRVYLLDGHGAPVPFGAAGELYIGGAGVARGYLNRPELTAERFIASPFVDGDRLYRTGDLARYLPDGNLEFLGRNDEQVKIRGFRIEPGEIAARLIEHAWVRDAVVVAQQDGTGEKRLVAYVVCAPEARSDERDVTGAELAATLRAHVGAHLPDYMMPAAFVRLAALPLTVNGKLDRKALPAPDDEAYAHRAYEPPQGEIEAALAQIWAELLGVERVGRHDHFFELGGHSLLAVQLLERLRRRSLGVEVRTLFAKPVLADLAASLGSHHEVAVPANLISEQSPAITPEMLPLIELTQGEIERIVATVPGGVGNIQDIYGLSPLQDGILFHHLLATKGDPYLLVSQMAFADRDLLERYLVAVQRVVDRHDILRTSFVWEGLSRPAQLVWRKARLEVIEVELDAAHGGGAEQLRDRFDPRRQRIELGRAPLLRFVIAREPGSARWLLLELQHHLIGDHTTLELMHAEVRAVLAGREHELAAPQPFRNLVAAAGLGVGAKAHEEFFRTMVGDIAEPTTPFGLSEVHGDGRGAHEAQRMLPQALNARLRSQARRLGVSLASLCHLAWGQVVARSSGREQVVFGTVLFGRLQGNAGADRAMGLFINTLPLRLDLDGTAVEASVRTTHARLAELLAHEHASLALAQRCSGVAAPAPLFSALLNYRHNTPAAFSASAADEVLSGVEWLGEEERTNYPLTLSVEDFGEALGLTAQVTEGVSADRICGYMQRALEQLAEALERAPDTPVRELDILPPEERTYLLEELNQTAATYPSDRCIHELFEAQVRQVPDAVAVVYRDQRVSYGELNAQANRLAHHLIALGVEPDQPVAICVARSPMMVVGLLAILKAGGAYVPLDPAYPSARLHQVLEDAAPRLLLTDAAGRTALGDVGLDASVVELDAAAPASTNLPESDPDPRPLGLTSRHLAYVIYTSGSTGTPKGVMVEHAQIVRLFEATQEWYGFTEQDVWCLFHSFSFDFSVWELWGALRYGGRLILVPSDTARSASDFDDLICKSGVTVLNQTPSAFKALVDLERQSGARNRLRYVIFGGEALEPSILKPWYASHSDRAPQLINMYGITETTVHVTYRSLDQSDTTDSGSQIGRRIPDLRIYLLDGHGAPVPFGAAGELYIGGAGVARGYLNRPELTAERFIASPFVDGDRLYRTGDLARYLPDGNLEFLGRNDEQVKIRGFRIEPGEIAARLIEHAWVRDAVVVAQQDGTGEKRLVAYVVCAPEARSDERDVTGAELAATLRAHVGAHLPDYMMPAAFVRLAALPLTVNGKLDRKALPAPDDEAYAHRAYEPPQGEIEAALAQIWAELLGVERVGRHDHFFELGGHSLLAVQLLERLRRRSLGVEVRTLFAKPVLADLAASLGSHHEVAVPANLISEQSPAITPEMLPLIELTQGEIERIVATVPGGVGNIQDIYGLSPLQDGILFHHLLATKGDPYLLVSQMAFADRDLLERYLVAVQRVVDRHDILRTSFVWEGLSRPAQLVWRKARLEVIEVELDAAHGGGAEQLRDRFDPRRQRIELGRAPLLRFVIAREPGSARWLLLELQHHLIGDHTTLELMHAEVRAVLAGREHELAAPQPFRNLVAAAGLGVGAKAHEEFFRTMVGDIAEPTTPFGLSEVHGDGRGAHEAQRMLPQALNARLRSQARRLGVSLASLCHLAWGQVVARSSGREQVVFGTVLFGRLQGNAGADRAMGLFINTLPLRLDLDGTAVEASVRTTHARLAELLAHEHASLALAQRCSGVAAPAPLFSALLNYRHNTPAAFSASAADEVLSGVEWLGEEERTNYPLTLSVEDFGEALGLTAQVTEGVSADRICGYMQRALEQLAEALERAPDTPVRELDILPPEERTYLLEELNQTAATYPSDRCIHELFEAQVRQVPDAVAVVYRDQRVSYGELNAQANRLAHHLIALGVEPDQPVAICVARSPMMVVGLLAILKAGGAYVPLDPAYPSARLHQVLEDAAPRLLLADAAGRAALGAKALADLTVVDLAAATPEWANLPASDPDPRPLGLTSRHLAYVIYTSGSTGTPKGVMIEHASTVNLLHWSSGVFAEETSRMLFSTSISFDLSVYECFVPLSQGSTLYLVESALTLAQTSLDVSLINTVPSAIASLVDNKAVPPSTRVINLAGERLKAGLIEKAFESSRVEKICNLYAPSETTTYSTWICMRRGETVVETIGRPIANTRVYLLDGHGAPIPFGAAGELYIGGAGVARGYLNRPELTAERFIASPFVDGDRLYRTGDLARYLPDGNLEFLGRNDEQVKIRGFRIEPGEIAARLIEHAWVRDAVVVAQQDGTGEKRLVAYVVCAPEARSDERDVTGAELAATLRAHVGAHLPDYMMPAAFVRLAALPLTVNGKLDRKALPAPDDEAYAHRAYELPQGEIEAALAQIWAELLGVKRVGRHDHFFELGGHSLLAVQLLSRALEAGLTFSAADLFQAPVLRELASKIHLKRQLSSPQVISILETGSQPPLFFVPTGLGDCSYVLPLVKEMDLDCPVYALPWPHFDDVHPPTLEAIAAEVMLAVREIQPQGPYRFAGYSSGAILAYAIAQQLLNLNEPVSFMAFMDAALPANRRSLSLTQMAREVLLDSMEFLEDESFRFLERFAANSSIGQLIQKAQQIGAIPLDRDLESLLLMYEKAAQFQRALELYEVPPLGIEINQFYVNAPVRSRRARRSIGQEASSPSRGWDRVLRPEAIHAVSVPGDHTTMMNIPENRRVLARCLSMALTNSPDRRQQS
ncbi:amino acid adenylation domain-containing protein [Bradyrhizobium sp. PMVTL-01]|uniref:non-ribosomal peptide synthetase n=1 Tax=Bradyrhizobium sp. PMVTL-01 TaxID=3434999 RepID=UPI003F70A702